MVNKDMSVQPIISIVIPVYNSAQFLKQCLDSVCGQTYPYLEIIAVNDGSEDDSLKILESYSFSDSRIKVINQKNKGLSGARNAGIDASSGDYIMFLDGDDWVDTTVCEKAISIAKLFNADVVLWSYCREYSTQVKPVYILGECEKQWDENNVSELYKQLVGLDAEQLREPQKTDAIVTAWGKLYRRSVIGNIRFVDTKIIGTEDVLFNIQVFSSVCSAAYIPETYSHYRKTNTDSLTHRYKADLATKWKNLYKFIQIHLDERKASPEFYKALDNRIALGLIGLGLNLAEDDIMGSGAKIKELKKILSMPHYKKALENLPMEYLPIHWKIFFYCAEKEAVIPMYILLKIMNYLRGR